MLHNQRAFALTCKCCGQTSHLTILVESDIGHMSVRCPACNGMIGALGQIELEASLTEEPIQPRRRARSRDTVERQSSAAMVRPFLRRISDWQLQSSYLRAKFAATKSRADERLAIQVQVGHLRRELHSTIEDIGELIEDPGLTARVRDVALALARLDEQLLEMLVAASATSLPSAR